MKNKIKNLEEKIRNENIIINNLIENLIDKIKVPGIERKEDGTYDISLPYKKIFDLEINKIIKIYQAELPYVKSNPQNIDLKVYESKHVDGMFKNNAVYFSQKYMEFYDELKSENLKYDVNSEGRVTYNKDGKSEKISMDFIKQENSNNYFLLKENEFIENNLSDMDQDVFKFLNYTKYEKNMFDILPHELMHGFGYRGHNDYEGVTEELTREIAYKYALKKQSFSRQENVKFMQNIERIIGRKKLAFYSNINMHSNEEMDSIISALLDEKILDISGERDLYKNYLKTQEKIDTIASKLEEEAMSGKITKEEYYKKVQENEEYKNLIQEVKRLGEKLYTSVDDFVQKNGSELYELGDDFNELANEEIINKEKLLQEVLQYQKNEIEQIRSMLQEINKSPDIIQEAVECTKECMYSGIEKCEDIINEELVKKSNEKDIPNV